MSNYEKIVTLFDTAEHAQAARTNLQHAGFSNDEISIVSGTDLPKSENALREPSLWHRMFGGDIEQHEATVYAKAVESRRRGADPASIGGGGSEGDGNSQPAQPG